MIDWNGNGRIDPTDIGISIAAEGDGEEFSYDEMTEEAEEEKEVRTERSPRLHSSCDMIRGFFSRLLKR